jgi:hypothetical protein
VISIPGSNHRANEALCVYNGRVSGYGAHPTYMLAVERLVAGEAGKEERVAIVYMYSPPSAVAHEAVPDAERRAEWSR